MRILLLLLMCCLISCSKEQQKQKIVTIDVGCNIENLQELKLSDFAESISYIPLETTDDCFLGSMHFLSCEGGNYMLSDRKKCFLFDEHGAYKATIGRKGRGAHEYQFFSSCDLKGDLVYIQDFREVKIYNVKGNFIRKFKLPNLEDKECCIHSWKVVNDSLIVGYLPNINGSQTVSALAFDMTGKVVKKYPNYVHFNREQLYITLSDDKASVYDFNGKIRFKEMMGDTVFSIDKELNITPEYRIDLGKYRWPDDFRGVSIEKHRKDWWKYIFVYDIWETSNFIFMKCGFGKHMPASVTRTITVRNQTTGKTPFMLGVFNKQTEKVAFVKPCLNEDIIRTTGIYNDIDGGPNFYPRQVIEDNTLIMWITAFELKKYVRTETFKNSAPNYPEKKKELLKLANSLDVYDNPVLMLVRLK